jgi:hypothetical protein
MLENLMQTLPQHRHHELIQQLDLLDRTVEEHFSFSEDLAVARIPDSQGLGGVLDVQPANGALTAREGGAPLRDEIK